MRVFAAQLAVLCVLVVVCARASMQDIEDTDDFVDQLSKANTGPAAAKPSAHDAKHSAEQRTKQAVPRGATEEKTTASATDKEPAAPASDAPRRPRVVSRLKTTAGASTASAPVSEAAAVGSAGAPNSAVANAFVGWLWRTWGMQISITALLLVFFANYLTGRRANREIAGAIELVVRPVFDQNFTRTRLPSNPDVVMDARSANSWLGTGTGRKNCFGAQAHLQLAARQDLLTGVIWGLVSPSQDTLTVSVALHPEDCSPARYVFALARKSQRKLVVRNFKEVTAVCGQTSVAGLHDSLVCLAEHDELAPQLLSPPLLASLNRSADLFDYAVVTDQWSGDPAVDVAPKYRHRLVVSVRVPELRRIPELEALVRGVFALLDAAANVSLTKHATAKGIKNRAAAAAEAERAAHKERQEKLAQKQVDKLNKLKAELELLPPDVRARREDEIKKKEQRKLMKRMAGVRVVKG